MNTSKNLDKLYFVSFSPLPAFNENYLSAPLLVMEKAKMSHYKIQSPLKAQKQEFHYEIPKTRLLDILAHKNNSHRAIVRQEQQYEKIKERKNFSVHPSFKRPVQNLLVTKNYSRIKHKPIKIIKRVCERIKMRPEITAIYNNYKKYYYKNNINKINDTEEPNLQKI